MNRSNKRTRHDAKLHKTKGGSSCGDVPALLGTSRYRSGAHTQRTTPFEHRFKFRRYSTCIGRQHSAFFFGKESSRPSRLFGFIPNYATVEGAVAEPPLTTRAKLKLTIEGAFDPYEFAIVGALAAVNQVQDQNPSCAPGFGGYSKRYAQGFADQAIGNLMTGAVLPSLFREDPRFY